MNPHVAAVLGLYILILAIRLADTGALGRAWGALTS